MSLVLIRDLPTDISWTQTAISWTQLTLLDPKQPPLVPADFSWTQTGIKGGGQLA